MALIISSVRTHRNSFSLANNARSLKFLNGTPLLPVYTATTTSSSPRDPKSAAGSTLPQIPKSITTTTSRLVTKLLTPYPTRFISYPFSTDSSTVELKNFNVSYSHVNPFEINEGNGSPFLLVQRKHALYARVDLPGATREGLKVWVENKRIHFEAHEVNYDEQFCKEKPRKFEGFIPFFPLYKYEVKNIRAELSNGVLRIKLPTAHQ